MRLGRWAERTTTEKAKTGKHGVCGDGRAEHAADRKSSLQFVNCNVRLCSSIIQTNPQGEIFALIHLNVFLRPGVNSPFPPMLKVNLGLVYMFLNQYFFVVFLALLAKNLMMTMKIMLLTKHGS